MAENSFCVQFKARSVREITYDRAAYEWSLLPRVGMGPEDWKPNRGHAREARLELANS